MVILDKKTCPEKETIYRTIIKDVGRV